jgi:hypothetical protein
MLICKIGKYHTDLGINKQDAGYADNRYKFVADGCGSSPHAEVGAQLAEFTFKSRVQEGVVVDIPEVCYDVFSLFDMEPHPEELSNMFVKLIRDYLLFTTLMVREYTDSFKVDYVGDGFVIEVHRDNSITYKELGAGQKCPDFYGYNYIPQSRFSEDRSKVEVDTLIYPKTEYKNIGIASDGLRFLFGMPKENQEEFARLLLKGKDVPVKLFINRNYSHFQDDITIAL